MSLIFRWLGVAGVELKAGSQVLAIDPFFTRPVITKMLLPLKPEPSLVAEKMPLCNYVLITHAHYDHLLDVPEVLQQTGALAYGSANACKILHCSGVPEAQVHEVRVGDRRNLGAFQVDVIRGQHSPIPFGFLFEGDIRPGIKPPLRVTDYRMDACLGYSISVMGARLLICAAEPHPADILFAVAQESTAYYTRLLKGVHPRTFIPIHWDNFTRPLDKPVHRFTRPSRLPLWQISRLARQVLPRVQVIIPEMFREYTLD